jgi:pimeloyl-ACP methyl ester carboxylesterase
VNSGSAAAEGAAIYYEDQGSGPVVVLIHAGVADSRMWDGVFEGLAVRFHAIRFDIRGFGRSAMRPGRFSYHHDLESLLDHLAVARASLVGCSFGGQIAIDFALAHPDRVRSLALVSAGIGGREPSEQMIRFGDEEEALLARGDIEGATELNVRTWVDGPYRAPGEVDAALRDRVRTMQRELFAQEAPEGMERLRLEPPAIGRLGEIRAPTLVIVGDRDLPEMIEAGDRLASGIPNARKVVFPGVAHLVSMERPERFLDVVTEFLDESGTP